MSANANSSHSYCYSRRLLSLPETRGAWGKHGPQAPIVQIQYSGTQSCQIMRQGAGPGRAHPHPRGTRPPALSLWVFIAPVCLLGNDAEPFSYASSSSPLKVGWMLVIMCNFSRSLHCSGILRQSVPASNACGISQVPLSATKECCMGGRVVSLYSHWTTRKNRTKCSCKELD